NEVLEAKGLALTLLPLGQVHGDFDVRLCQPQALDQNFGLKAVAARPYPEALENRSLVNLQAVVIRETTTGGEVDEQGVHLGDQRTDPGARAPHIARKADDDVRISDTAEKLVQSLRPPRVVTVHHDNVIQRRSLDPTAVRPAESHVPLVDQKPD